MEHIHKNQVSSQLVTPIRYYCLSKMTWTSEKPDLTQKDVIWLEVQKGDTFILEQKLKDVSTPRGGTRNGRNRSSTIGSYRRSGSKNELLLDDPRYLKETSKFDFKPKVFSEALILFRIRTNENLTREGTPLVIAVSYTLDAILEKWDLVQSNIVNNIKLCGLHKSLKVSYTPLRYYDFMLFQICSFARNQKEVEDPRIPFNLQQLQPKKSPITKLKKKTNEDEGRTRKPLRRASFGPDLIPTINEIRRIETTPLRFSDPYCNVVKPKLSSEEIIKLSKSPISIPSQFDIEETVLHALNCILVSVKQKIITNKQSEEIEKENKFFTRIKRKFHYGILILTESYLSFYISEVDNSKCNNKNKQKCKSSPSSPTSNIDNKQYQLKLKLSEIERISHNPPTEDGELPSSFSILHNTRKQFIFIGVNDNTILSKKLQSLWEKHLTTQQKKLKKRLKKQTFVEKSSPSSSPLSSSSCNDSSSSFFNGNNGNQISNSPQNSSLPKIVSFFAKKIQQHGQNSENQIESHYTPTTTKLPLFSLPPFVLETAQSEKCSIFIENFLEFNISGKFYLTDGGGIFVSKKNNFLFTMYHNCIKSINYTDICSNSSSSSSLLDFPDIEVKFTNFRFTARFSDLSQEISNKWIKEWFLAIEKWNAVDLLHYSEFIDEHDSIDLMTLKQSYLETKLPADHEHLLHFWKLYYKTHAEANLHTDILQRLIFIGIPNSLRGFWWCSLLNVREKRLAVDEVPYGYMISHFNGKQSTATLEIQRDIHRSLPEHDYYNDDQQGCQVLESVLTAYSWRNSAIGYCQSMNLVCALLLLYMSEEDAYSVLCIICGLFYFFFLSFTFTLQTCNNYFIFTNL